MCLQSPWTNTDTVQVPVSAPCRLALSRCSAVSALTTPLISECSDQLVYLIELLKSLSVFPYSLPPACSLWHVFIPWKPVSFPILAANQTCRCGLWKNKWGEKVKIESCLNKCISSLENVCWALCLPGTVLGLSFQSWEREILRTRELASEQRSVCCGSMIWDRKSSRSANPSASLHWGSATEEWLERLTGHRGGVVTQRDRTAYPSVPQLSSWLS